MNCKNGATSGFEMCFAVGSQLVAWPGAQIEYASNPRSAFMVPSSSFFFFQARDAHPLIGEYSGQSLSAIANTPDTSVNGIYVTLQPGGLPRSTAAMPGGKGGNVLGYEGTNNRAVLVTDHQNPSALCGSRIVELDVGADKLGGTAAPTTVYTDWQQKQLVSLQEEHDAHHSAANAKRRKR